MINRLLLTICLMSFGLYAVEMDDLIIRLSWYKPKKRLIEFKEAKKLSKEDKQVLLKRLKETDDPELKFVYKNLRGDVVDGKFIKTASGLKYKIIKKGKGVKPNANSKVTVHYVGKLKNGQEFDSSYKRGQPTTFGLSQVIKGWTEGLQLMPAGSKFEFIIPAELAYGENGAGDLIPPNSELIFTIELLEVQ